MDASQSNYLCNEFTRRRSRRCTVSAWLHGTVCWWTTLSDSVIELMTGAECLSLHCSQLLLLLLLLLLKSRLHPSVERSIIQTGVNQSPLNIDLL